MAISHLGVIMKIMLFLIVFISFSAWSVSIGEFSRVMNQEVLNEIRKDEDKYKKESSRAPASVDESIEDKKIEEPNKIDKNVRQIGPNNW